jgi:hypothetical protein
MQFIIQYWGIILVVVLAALYAVFHYKQSYEFAKKVAIKFIFIAEKKAEDFLLTNGPAKLAWVVDKGYDLMPAGVRLIISKPLFKMIVQQLFDAAVELAKEHQIQQPDPPQPAPQPPQPADAATVAQNPQ